MEDMMQVKRYGVLVLLGLLLGRRPECLDQWWMHSLRIFQRMSCVCAS